VGRPAKLNAVAGWNRGLDLQINLQMPRLGSTNQIVHDVAVAMSKVGRFRRLIAQTPIERLLWNKTWSSVDKQLVFSPERSIEQSHGARARVVWWLPDSGCFISSLHDVGRRRHGVHAGLHDQVIQDCVHTLALKELGKNGDTHSPIYHAPILARGSSG